MAKMTKRQMAKRVQKLSLKNKAIANSEYNQVTIAAAPFNLRALMLDVAAAQRNKEQKTTQSKSLDEKQVAADLALAQEKEKVATEHVVQQEQHLELTNQEIKKVKEAREGRHREQRPKVKAEGVDFADAAEKVPIFSVLVNSKLKALRLTKESLDELATYQRRARDAVATLPVGSDARISLFSKYAAAARLAATLEITPIATSSDEEGPQGDIPTEQERPNEPEKEDKRKSVRDRLLGEQVKKRGWRVLELAKNLIGAGKETADALASRGRRIRTSIAPITSSSTTFAVQAAGKIGTGLATVGKAIKENGTNTLKWIGRKLSGLTSGIMRMFRSVSQRFTAGGIEDLAGMAAIGVGILTQVVSGMMDFLKKKFDKEFILSYIKEKWEITKKLVTDWLGEFIDKALSFIKDLPKKVAEGASSAWNKTKKVVKDFFVGDEGALVGPPHLKDTDKTTATFADKPVDSARAKLNSLMTSYSRAGTPAKKAEIEKKIRELVTVTPSLYNDSQVINNLAKRGIVIDAKISRATANTSIASASPQSSIVNSTVIGASPGSPITRGGNASIISVGQSPVTANPVTASPPPVENSAASSDGSSDGTRVVGGMNSFLVPVNAAPYTLFFMNLASMGAA